MTETISAIATPPGQGGIGIVRVSGPLTRTVSIEMLGLCPEPRQATFAKFNNAIGETIDEGIAIFFEAPHSFTGEDVLELQGHGGDVVQQQVLDRVLELGVRLANPGEFTQRAFLNDRLDLAQAEAVADLIQSASKEAARAAIRSLTGEFSELVMKIDADILSLRVFIEGAIDFPEEEVDFLAESDAIGKVIEIDGAISDLLERARVGTALQTELNIVIGGVPNVGKSSLMNALLGHDRAIVTPIAGTTRDTLDAKVFFDGLPVRLVDTAGLHESENEIEREGIARAQSELGNADGVLWVIDDRSCGTYDKPDMDVALILVWNKCDLSGNSAGRIKRKEVRISVKTGAGLDVLREEIKSLLEFHSPERAIAGRPRHLLRLRSAGVAVAEARLCLQNGTAELAADFLRAAQFELGEIVGQTTTDDVLGEIFSRFCIGK